MSRKWSVMRPINRNSNMSHIWILIFLSVSFLGRSVQDGLAQGVRLDFGGRIIELADGNVTDSLAKEVISYSRNLYERAAYSKTERYLSALISRYDGVELGNAHFLRGKARFMDNGLRRAYADFLTLFDGYRNSPPVRNGDLKVTIATALDHIVKLANLSNDKCCQDIDLSRLDIMMMFYELYKYVSGESSLEKMEQILATKYTRKMTLTEIWREQKSRGGGEPYKFDLGKRSWAPAILAAAITDAALEEWRYMKLLKENTTVFFTLGYSRGGTHMNRNFHHSTFGPSLDLGTSVTAWWDGKELSDYAALVSELLETNDEEYTISPNGTNGVKFSVRGPYRWSWKGLDTSGGSIRWSDDSYMGPVEVDFVVRDLIEARHGSVGEWVGLRKTRDQL